MASKSQLSSPSSQKLYGYQRDISYTVVSLSDLNGLLDVLVAIAGEWELFLIALGVSKGDINQIKTERAQLPNSSKLCLLDGLERWVKSSKCPTYGRIIEALNTELITDKPLAAKVVEFARQVSQDKAVQPVKPVPAALPQPLSVDQPTSSGGTSCEPTSPPHQTSPTPADTHTVPAEPASQPQPSSDVDTKAPEAAATVENAPSPSNTASGVCMYDKAHAVEKSKALQKRFILCAKTLKNHLKKESSFSDFLDEFIMELPLAIRDEHEKFFDRKNSEISKATTFDELFLCLSTYWDFLNYTLLEGIIDVHGTEEMQQEMESFVRDVQDFRKKTTLNVFWQLERHRMPTKPPPGFRKFVTKHSITRESTLEDIEKIRFEITQEFHLSKFALLLIDVVDGSVLITWFVPSSIISQLQERLGSLTGLHIEDIFYDSSDIPQDSPNPQDSGSLSLPSSPHSTEGKHTPSSRDLTPLFHTAAESGDADIVRRLLKDGVDVNEKRDGQTAVMLAARNGRADIVSILMESGADPNVGDSGGHTALMLAAEDGHTDTVQALAALGADIHTKSKGGHTALMWAAWYGRTDTVQALAALGADLHIKSKLGLTALMLAAERGRTDTVQALAALGADIHIKDEYGQTALMWAARGGHTDTVQALAALGADIHTKDQLGRTALLWAAEDGHTDTVQALEALGANMHVKDKYGKTAQTLAAEHRRHTHDKFGRTALMLAAEQSQTDTLQALVALGTDALVKHKLGRTAQTLAPEHRSTHVKIPRVKIPSREKESSSSYSGSHFSLPTIPSPPPFSFDTIPSPPPFSFPTIPSPPPALDSPFSLPSRLTPDLRSHYLPSSDSGLGSTTTDEFSSGTEESYLSYSKSGRRRRRATPPPPPPVTPEASQPGGKELMKAKTAQHREHSQP